MVQFTTHLIGDNPNRVGWLWARNAVVYPVCSHKHAAILSRPSSSPADALTKVRITVTETEQSNTSPTDGGAEPEQEMDAPEGPQAGPPTEEGDHAHDNLQGGQGEDKPDEGAAEDPAQAELSALRAERDKLRDQLLRATADFENFRRRSRREIDEAKLRGKDDAVKELLPVFDNLERAVQASESATEVASVVEGVNMVLKLFEDTAQRMGMNRVPGVGEQFDPAVHEAIQQLETNEHPPGAIVSEVAPGYRFGQRLLRAGMVVVARPPRNTDTQSPESRERTSDIAPKGTDNDGEADATGEDS